VSISKTSERESSRPQFSSGLSILLFIIISLVRLSPLGATATAGLLYQPQMIDDGDCGAIGEMRIGRENRNTRTNLPQCHFIHHKSHMT
jgi:hypothetical protein